MSSKLLKYCELHKMYYYRNYIHIRVGKKGVTIYRGGWAETRFGNWCSTCGLSVMRGEDQKPIRFKTLDDAVAWLEEKGK